MATNTLGTLLIELKAKTDAFERGMKSARDLSFTTSAEIVGSLERIGKSLLNLRFNNFDQAGRSMAIMGGIAAATGAALTTSILAVATETSKKMVEMGHDAEKAGMGIREFSENVYAAKRAGLDIDTFTSAMGKLAKTAVSAAQGNAQAVQTLKNAGTSATDSQGRLRSTGDILSDIVKKYEKTTDATLKSGLAQQAFSKGVGLQMVPFLNLGTATLQKYRAEADRLGESFGPDTLANAKNFRGELAEMKGAAEGAAIQFTAGLLPALNQVLSSLTEVTGNKSAMRDFGETVGDAFRGIASSIYYAVFAWEYWTAKTQKPTKTGLGLDILEGITNPLSLAGHPQDLFKDVAGVLSGKDQGAEADIQAAENKLRDRLTALYAPPPKGAEEKRGKGTAGLDAAANNFATQEIQKLRERAQANLALAAAQLIGEQSVRATSAANQADAIILQIATNASKEHKTALEAEIIAAQKKYGATVLSLVAIEQEASRNQAFNKTLSDQTDEANISADAHKRMAEAIMQGGAAITEASIANQIDALVKKADLKLTQDQIDALNKLKDAKRADADAAISEAITRETVSLTNAAHATQLLIVAQREGSDAEIEARAQIEAENFAIQNNIDLNDKRIAQLKEQIAANMRASQAQTTGSSLTSQYDPSAERQRRIEEINAAEAAGTVSAVAASRARDDAYLREQEALDQLALRTQRASAGFRVALNEIARQGRDWATTMHDGFMHVWDGFDQGFRNSARNVLMGVRTIGQGFRDLGVSILGSMIDAFAGIAAKWIETHLLMGAINLIFHTQQAAEDATAAGTRVALNAAANTTMAISDAGLAAAGAFAYYSATAPEVALPLAMAQYAEGLSIAGLAAFDFGGIMPKTGIALVHQDEGVLTGPTTRMLTSVNKMVNSMDSNHLAAAAYAGGSAHPSLPPITIHVNGAQDPDLVAQKVSDAVMARVRRNFRTAGVSR